MKRIIALLATAGLLLLTGCSQVGVAASVGDVKITQATVQNSINTVLAERAKISTTGMQLETGETLNRSQLRFHLMRTLLGDVAKDEKITVSKAEIDARRESIIKQVNGAAQLPKALVGAGIASTDLDNYIELIIISEKISQALAASGVAQANVGMAIQKMIVTEAAKLKVVINPRYGKWNSATGDIVSADTTKSAVTPAKTP